jgi:hypothetical protein
MNGQNVRVLGPLSVTFAKNADFVSYTHMSGHLCGVGCIVPGDALLTHFPHVIFSAAFNKLTVNFGGLFSR